MVQGPPGQVIRQPFVPGNQPPQQVVLDTSGLERTFIGMTGAVERLAQQQNCTNDQLNESVREQRKSEKKEGKFCWILHMLLIKILFNTSLLPYPTMMVPEEM